MLDLVFYKVNLNVVIIKFITIGMNLYSYHFLVVLWGHRELIRYSIFLFQSIFIEVEHVEFLDFTVFIVIHFFLFSLFPKEVVIIS